MDAITFARTAVDLYGYIVMGSDEPHEIGDVIDDNPIYSKTERLQHPVVVIGESSLEECLGQCDRLIGYRPLWRKPYYYRVTAE